MIHSLTDHFPLIPHFGNGDLSNTKGIDSGDSLTPKHPKDPLDVNCSPELSDHQNQEFNNRMPPINDALEALRLGGVRRDISSLTPTQSILKESPTFANRVLFITNNHQKNL
tara:strand:+ start:105 stop:440 length:336 start_codon:yes stop_codon:yes gene_type:complete